MDFPLLRELKTLDDICPIHKEHLVQLRDSKPICQSCTREELKRESLEIVHDSMIREHERRTIKTLEMDSILNDKTIKKATFKNYEASNDETENAKKLARKIAYKYLDRNNKFNTILTGNPGVGKSHLAMSMLKAVNENFSPWGSCLFISVNDLMRLIKNSFDDPQSRYTETNMVNLLGGVDLLVLDDLGSESSFKRDTRESSEYTQQFLFGVLDRRERTIITTNLNSEQLAAIYNPKLISRMYKGINGHIIKFTEKTEDKRKVVF